MLAHFAAATMSAVWLIVHLVLGGRQIAAPLRASATLDPVVRDTQYLCWHFTSCAILAMAAAFALSATTGIAAYAVAGTGLATLFALSGIGLTLAIGQRFADLPQGWLFVPVAALGLWGLLA